MLNNPAGLRVEVRAWAGGGLRTTCGKIVRAAIPGGFAARLRGLASSGPIMRELAGGLAWSVGAVAAERLIAVAQAFYVARLLRDRGLRQIRPGLLDRRVA